MRTRFRIFTLWLAAAFVLAGSAIGFAKVGDNHGADVSQVAKPSATPSAEPTTVDDENESDEAKDASQESGERKLNHGFYVSKAAHCEDVDDPDTTESPDFEAPDDCSGADHGKFVRDVAKSSVGKPDKGHGSSES